jgi:hypothetical protein
MMRRHLTLLGSLATLGMTGLLALPAVAQQTLPGSSSPTTMPPSATGSLALEPSATSQGMRRNQTATMQNGRTTARSRRGGADRGSASQDNMADQLNAQSLQRAQAGQSLPTPGPDSTSNLNRMSDQDAHSGRTMPQPAMPFR